MKPPRLIIHSNCWYVSYYLPDNKTPQQEPVGERADIPKWKDLPEELRSKLPQFDWWRPVKKINWPGSKHWKKIEESIQSAELNRQRYIHLGTGPSPRFVITLPQLFKEYGQYRQARGGVESPATLQKRKQAVAILLRFDPNVQLRYINDKWLSRFRAWLDEEITEAGILKPRCARTTQQTYAKHWRGMFRYAARKKYIRDNPFEDMRVTAELSRPVHTRPDSELAFFDTLFRIHFDLALQLLFLRTHGYRPVESCKLSLSEVDPLGDETLRPGYMKMRKEDIWPITPLTKTILSLTGNKYTPFVFHFRSSPVMYAQLRKLAKKYKFAYVTPKQMKKNWGKEAQSFCRNNPTLYNLMLHHTNTGMTRIGETYYTGENVELMRETAGKIQSVWEARLSEWSKLRPESGDGKDAFKNSRWSKVGALATQ